MALVICNVPVAPFTPIVVFAHVPLWIVYQDWGWGTKDGGQALSYLKRFGSVTVLNGHIHQVMQKVEGQVAFHTARSTAFPQGVPGVAKGPGPAPVPRMLGCATVVLFSTCSGVASSFCNLPMMRLPAWPRLRRPDLYH